MQVNLIGPNNCSKAQKIDKSPIQPSPIDVMEGLGPSFYNPYWAWAGPGYALAQFCLAHEHAYPHYPQSVIASLVSFVDLIIWMG